MTILYKKVDRLCFRVVMLWPGAWPANAVADWMLSRAGRGPSGPSERAPG